MIHFWGWLYKKTMNLLRFLSRSPLRSKLRMAHFNKKARFAGNSLFSEFSVTEGLLSVIPFGGWLKHKTVNLLRLLISLAFAK